MKLIDKNGNYVGEMRYTNGHSVAIGDAIKLAKVYKVVGRVWDASIGEITELLVDEVVSVYDIFV